MYTLRFKAIAVALAASFSLSAPMVHAASGDLDSMFGVGGYVITPIQDISGIDGVTLDSKKRLVVAGSSSELTLLRTTPVIARYLSDGSLDTDFGGGTGIAFVTPPDGLGDQADFCCVKVDSKNRIVAAGVTQVASPTGLRQILTVVRLTEDGERDASFGSNGFVQTLVEAGEERSRAHSMAVDDSDRIVVGAETFDSSFLVTPLLVRYNENGGLDHSFNGVGMVDLSDTGYTAAPSVSIDSGERIVAAGDFLDTVTSESSTYVKRYSSDGTLDTTFGTAGSVTLEGVVTDAVLLDSKDRVVVASASIDGANMGMERLSVDGSIDVTFGPDGTGVVFTPVDADIVMTPGALAQDNDGNIVMAAIQGGFSEPSMFVTARYSPDGILDTSFGINGISLPAPPSNAAFGGMVFDPASNTMTIAGYASDEVTGQSDFTAVRFKN